MNSAVGPRVLVTGASGFVGRHIPPFLLEAGYDVHVVGRKLQQGAVEWPGRKVVFHPLDLLAADTSDFSHIAAQRADLLLHAAWIATPGVFWTSLENFAWVGASIRLLEAFARGGGRRAVIVGTCAEYDWTHHTMEEDVTPLTPTTLYGESKASLFRMLVAAGPAIGFSWAWGRLFFPYGPFENPGRLLSHVIVQLLNGIPAECSEGRQVRDFMHVSDAAAALVHLLDSSLEGPVNIASGAARSVREVVTMAAEIVGRSDLVRFGARPTAPNDPPCLAASTSRLHLELGFRPRFDLDSGLKATVDWWREELSGQSAAVTGHVATRP